MPTPRNIEGLLFDLGGVVIEIDFERALQSWKQWTPLSIEEMRDRFKMDDAYQNHERGEVEASEYFAHLRHMLEIEASDAQIKLGWNAIFLDEIAETVNYIRAVNSDLPCFAFTNSNPTHQVSFMSAFPRVVESFRQVFVSSELGLRKPEPAAFAAIAEATGIRLEAMLFFDDTDENVYAAKTAGMQVVHVKGHLDVKQALSRIGAL